MVTLRYDVSMLRVHRLALLLLTPGLLMTGLTACGGGDKVSSATSATPSASVSIASPSAAASAEASEPAASSAAGVYTNPAGFSITFPKDWTVRPNVAGLQVLGTPAKQAVPDFANNVGVLLESTGRKDLTVQEYLKASVQQAPKIIKNFTVIRQDAEAGTLEYTGTVGRPLHFLARVVIKDGKAFTGTFTATDASFAAGRADAEAVLKTLQAS